MWIDPGEDSRGIAAHGGDTFAVANEQGRLLYEHTMPVKHARSSTERNSLKLLNLGCELDAAMRLMSLLDFHSQDLLEDLSFLEKQVWRFWECRPAFACRDAYPRALTRCCLLSAAQLKRSRSEEYPAREGERSRSGMRKRALSRFRVVDKSLSHPQTRALLSALMCLQRQPVIPTGCCPYPQQTHTQRNADTYNKSFTYT